MKARMKVRVDRSSAVLMVKHEKQSLLGSSTPSSEAGLNGLFDKKQALLVGGTRASNLLKPTTSPDPPARSSGRSRG